MVISRAEGIEVHPQSVASDPKTSPLMLHLQVIGVLWDLFINNESLAVNVTKAMETVDKKV